MSNITSKILIDRINQGAQFHLIDVRTAPEFNSERIDAKCRNVPLDDIRTIDLPKESEIVMVCASGKRSARAREILAELGYTNVYSLDGGLVNWKANKLPTKRNEGVLPIMQQTQVAAGILVLIGALGSLLITSGFIWLAIFIGIGLIYAGLSGWCGLAKLLGHLPWNRQTRECSQ